MQKMKIITLDDFKTRFSVQENVFLENTDKETLDSYLLFYSYMQTLLNVFVAKKLGIERYDSYLEYSELNYKKILEEEMDVYQFLGSSVMKYFYVRNNLYLERLTKEEMAFFIEKMEKNPFTLDEQVNKIMRNILTRIIVETNKQSGEVGIINFGPEQEEFFAPMNALIIGLRYDEFYNENISDDEWDKNYDAQMKELEKLVLQLNTEISSKLSIPVKVIRYNEFSIKNKISGEQRV